MNRPFTIAFASVIFCALSLAFASTGSADSADDWARMKVQKPRNYVCGRTATPPAIDGRLDDDAWHRAPWTDAFVDIEGDRQPVPAHRTRVKMLWDDQCFFLGAQLDEPHVWGTIRQRDAVIFHDNDFELFVDPDGDNHDYYEFEINALNTGWDLFLPKPYKDGGQADNGWDIAGLKTAVHIDGTVNDPSDTDRGWSVEIAIPWSSLTRSRRTPAPPAAGDLWRINYSRVEWQHEIVDGQYRKIPKRPENNWVWSPQGIIDMHRPERWGYVQFANAAPGEASFQPDPAFAIRDALMEVYHHQKSFHGRHGRWAERLDELGIPLESWKALGAPPSLRRTDDGFEATLPLTTTGGKRQTWHVRQDSRLWATSVDEYPDAVRGALDRAEGNREQLERALRDTPADQQEGMLFLIANMPLRDLRGLSAEYLRENVDLAYQAWNESTWKERVPKDVFLNDLMPYSSINERRDRWRRDFRERCLPLIKDAQTPSHAAALLNQKIYPLFNVRYSTKRTKADQSPYESIESGLASCTGLSVLLIDACRAVGVPARFVGTPLWSDKSGNHSWVEVWDQGWHFTGAAEPSGDKLDSVWFSERASGARRDDLLHAIYAVSFRRTPTPFPMVWAPRNADIFAVNVTDRYTKRSTPLPEGSVAVMIRVVDSQRDRVAARVSVRRGGDVVFEGTTNDERFDANDHLTMVLKTGEKYELQAQHDGRTARATLDSAKPGQLVTLTLEGAAPNPPGKEATTPKTDAPAPRKQSETQNGGGSSVDPTASSAALRSLQEYLGRDDQTRGAILDQAFANTPLTREDAGRAEKLLCADHAKAIRATRAAEMTEGKLKLGDWEMPFFVKLFGDKPATGRALYISMHGGGGAPKQVNDGQWENQKRLYSLAEGVYVAPRAPTDTWNLWHQEHIDPLFDRLIENLIVLEEVDPNRVYLMGYSAGGDGVYQLAPRMADRLAAAAMMAGHPNETSPLGLRNLPFTIHVGGKDAAYQRNQVAADWEKQLAALKQKDPDGYPHLVKVYPEKGHWMDREDAAAILWMAQFTRNPLPTKIVWKQDDVTHSRFYWLAVDDDQRKQRTEVVATREKQRIDLHSDQVERLRIRLNDRMLDLDQPIAITRDGTPLVTASVPRTISVLHKTLYERGDPSSVFSGEVVVNLATP